MNNINFKKSTFYKYKNDIILKKDDENEQLIVSNEIWEILEKITDYDFTEICELIYTTLKKYINIEYYMVDWCNEFNDFKK